MGTERVSLDFSNDFEVCEMYCNAKDCNFEAEFDGEFQECIETAKESGWLIRKEGENWKHYCPTCREFVERRS